MIDLFIWYNEIFSRLAPTVTCGSVDTKKPGSRSVPGLLGQWCRGQLLRLEMTKLMQWIVLLGIAFSVWVSILIDVLPIKPSSRTKEVLWLVSVYNNSC